MKLGLKGEMEKATRRTRRLENKVKHLQPKNNNNYLLNGVVPDQGSGNLSLRGKRYEVTSK